MLYKGNYSFFDIFVYSKAFLAFYGYYAAVYQMAFL